MIERLPYYYRKSKVVNDFYDVIKKIIDKVELDIAAADKRLFIITTDDFTLHEKDVSLSAITADNETKRARVMARLQGSEVLTVEALKSLVTLYEKSGIEVEEQFGDYVVTLVFPNREGTPENITEILLAVEEVKPAHIKIGLTFIRNPIGGISFCGVIQKQKNITMQPADATWNMPIRGIINIGGRVQKLKNIYLEAGNG